MACSSLCSGGIASFVCTFISSSIWSCSAVRVGVWSLGSIFLIF
ncbi:hypothetical protein QW060_17970 [Myroides ceti]|uniref:Uncharacterized protein n=1 Tax=Paenimyroides ceti TaxID=395087 RepID=A0ABT8CWQ0_9FLAO|nr:hypothetical protein [Paenimyroides ceti]MDN3708964.1 hypothetical protein [Paenimyroides ceti]